MEYRSLTVAVIALASSGCQTSTALNLDWCGHQAANITCAAANPAAPYCNNCETPDDPDRTGCVAEPPTDECLPPGWDPGHCALQTSDFDGYCMAQTGLPICNGCRDENLGCVSERADPDHCYAEPGVDDDSSSSTTEPTGTGPTGPTMTSVGPATSTADTTDTGTDTDGGCATDDDCSDGGAPFCVQEVCVACDQTPDGDAACDSLGQGTPACFEGGCVECTAAVAQECAGATPYCDDDTNTCVPCTFHFQCPDSACRIADGTCFDPALAEDVFNGADIQGAVADGATLMLNATASYSQEVTIDSGDVVAIVADAGTEPLWMDEGGGAPILTIESGAVVYLHRLRLAGNSAEGIAVDGATLFADESKAVQNDGGGITATNSATLNLRNCFVGASNLDARGMTLSSSSASVLYSTVVGGPTIGGGAMAPALECSGGGTIDVRNSFLVALNPEAEIDCPGASFSYTATETAIAGVGNLALGDQQANWFVDVAQGDYHLMTAPAGLSTTAQWQSADPDPPFDIDLGDARPAADGAMDFAGADVP